MKERKDITGLPDIELLVNSFYAEVRKDELLGPVFEAVLHDRWPAHLGKMVSFWQAVLLGGNGYAGRPFAPHASLPVNKEHFDRWVGLFGKVTDDWFVGEKAEEAKWRASKMAVLFLSKMDYISKNPGKVVI